MRIETIYLYEDRKDVSLTTYLLENVPEYHYNEKRPAILICPGGGYMECSDREGEPLALTFATMGYHAFVLRYSVYGREGYSYMPNPKELPLRKELNYPTQMLEVAKAMTIIKQNADTWFVDPERIALCGGSAGGHLVAMYATHWNTPLVRDCMKVDAEMLRPAACITCYAVLDFRVMAEQGGPIAVLSNAIMAGAHDSDDETNRVISPVCHVNADTPPMFLWATAEDTLVPALNTLKMAQALAEHQIPYEVHVFESGDHGLSIANQLTAIAQEQVRPEVAQWVPMCDAWLKKRFAYKLPEKLPSMEEIFSRP